MRFELRWLESGVPIQRPRQRSDEGCPRMLSVGSASQAPPRPFVSSASSASSSSPPPLLFHSARALSYAAFSSAAFASNGFLAAADRAFHFSPASLATTGGFELPASFASASRFSPSQSQ